jgi:hypothetical protein
MRILLINPGHPSIGSRIPDEHPPPPAPKDTVDRLLVSDTFKPHGLLFRYPRLCAGHR